MNFFSLSSGSFFKINYYYHYYYLLLLNFKFMSSSFAFSSANSIRIERDVLCSRNFSVISGHPSGSVFLLFLPRASLIVALLQQGLCLQ